jgi:hypothetical protein
MEHAVIVETGAGVLVSQLPMKRVNSRLAENDSELSAEMY